MLVLVVKRRVILLINGRQRCLPALHLLKRHFLQGHRILENVLLRVRGRQTVLLVSQGVVPVLVLVLWERDRVAWLALLARFVLVS